MLPEPSTTVQVTVVLPIGNEAGASFVTLATEQLSAVTGVPSVTPVAVQAVFVVVVTAAGAVIVGLILSTNVTVAVPVLLFPEVSVTVRVTVFAPKSSQVNEFGATLMLAICTLSVDPLLTWFAVILAKPLLSKLMVIF